MHVLSFLVPRAALTNPFQQAFCCSECSSVLTHHCAKRCLLECFILTDAWKSLTDKVQEARSNARLKQLSFAGNGSSGPFTPGSEESGGLLVRHTVDPTKKSQHSSQLHCDTFIY